MRKNWLFVVLLLCCSLSHAADSGEFVSTFRTRYASLSAEEQTKARDGLLILFDMGAAKLDKMKNRDIASMAYSRDGTNLTFTANIAPESQLLTLPPEALNDAFQQQALGKLPATFCKDPMLKDIILDLFQGSMQMTIVTPKKEVIFSQKIRKQDCEALVNTSKQ